MTQGAGKVNVTLIVVTAFVVGLVVMALSSGQTPTSVAGRFMSALADGDTKTLAELSYADGDSQEAIERQWDFTMNVAAKHYQFTYEIKGESKLNDKAAIVRMDFVKNAGASGSYDERFELPMVMTDDGWKVEVYALNRDMFPGLPRG